MVEAFRVQYHKDVKDKSHEDQDRRLFTHKVMEDLIVYQFENISLLMYHCLLYARK